MNVGKSWPLFFFCVVVASSSYAYNSTVVVSFSSVGNYTDSGNLLQNGNLENNTLFDSASAATKTSFYDDGTNTGLPVNAWRGTWAARTSVWSNQYGVIGMPDNWTTTTNGGNPTALVAPGSSPSTGLNNGDFHGRWVRFNATFSERINSNGTLTGKGGLAGSYPRPASLGNASLYFGTAATRLNAVGNVSTTINFGTENATTGVVTLNPNIASADQQLLRNGQIRAGNNVGGVPVNQTINGSVLTQVVTGLTIGYKYDLKFWISGEFAFRDGNGNYSISGLSSGNGTLNRDYSYDNGMVALAITGVSELGGNATNEPLFLSVPSANSTVKYRWYDVQFFAANSTTTLSWIDYGHLDTTTGTGFGADSTTETVIDGLQLSLVPEPASAALMLFGVSWLGLRRRRR